MNERVRQRLGDAAQFETRRQAWARFHRSEHAGGDDRPIGRVIADLGALRGLLPDGVRRHDPDPAKQGIARMHRDLAGLDRPR